jgi:hypothetical protein
VPTTVLQDVHHWKDRQNLIVPDPGWLGFGSQWVAMPTDLGVQGCPSIAFKD